MGMKTKSFRYSPEEHPKVEQWIQSLERSGINFSVAIRRLIEECEIEKDRIRKEIEMLRQQVESLRETGYQLESPIQKPKVANEEEPESVAVNTTFIRNRYFS